MAWFKTTKLESWLNRTKRLNSPVRFEPEVLTLPVHYDYHPP